MSDYDLDILTYYVKVYKCLEQGDSVSDFTNSFILQHQDKRKEIESCYIDMLNNGFATKKDIDIIQSRCLRKSHKKIMYELENRVLYLDSIYKTCQVVGISVPDIYKEW